MPHLQAWKSRTPHLHDCFIKSIKSSPNPEFSEPGFFAARRASKPPRFRAFVRFLTVGFPSGTDETELGLARDWEVDIDFEFNDVDLCLLACDVLLRGNRVFLPHVSQL
jgi:hypothetical protein